LKIVSVLVDVDPPLGTPEGEQLATLGALVVAYEVNVTTMISLVSGSQITLSENDFSAFSKALTGDFAPNPALKKALAVAAKSVHRI
jgi:Protein of unknown function (DUF1778)